MAKGLATPREQGAVVERKRRTYLFAMLLTLPFLPYVAVAQRGEEPGAVALYSTLGVMLVGLGVGLATRRLSVRAAERTILVILPVLVVGRLLAVWFQPGTGLPELRRLVTETAGPTLIAAVLLTFLAFETRVAHRWAVAIWLLFTAALVPAIVLDGGANPSAAVALVRQSLIVLVVVALAAFLASLKAELAAERARAESFETLARTDPLTGALNRRGAEEALAAQVARLRRYGDALTVALLDVDRFKARNDHLGHIAGDQALVRIVAALQQELRTTDHLARWGGDELLVVLPATDGAAAHASAERWRQVVRALELHADEGQILSVSIGLAEALPVDSIDELLLRADRAMYRAKAEGGDEVVLAASPPTTDAAADQDGHRPQGDELVGS